VLQQLLRCVEKVSYVRHFSKKSLLTKETFLWRHDLCISPKKCFSCQSRHLFKKSFWTKETFIWRHGTPLYLSKETFLLSKETFSCASFDTSLLGHVFMSLLTKETSFCVSRLTHFFALFDERDVSNGTSITRLYVYFDVCSNIFEGCLRLQVIFGKRATNYRALLRKTY